MCEKEERIALYECWLYCAWSSSFSGIFLCIASNIRYNKKKQERKVFKLFFQLIDFHAGRPIQTMENCTYTWIIAHKKNILMKFFLCRTLKNYPKMPALKCLFPSRFLFLAVCFSMYVPSHHIIHFKFLMAC